MHKDVDLWDIGFTLPTRYCLFLVGNMVRVALLME